MMRLPRAGAAEAGEWESGSFRGAVLPSACGVTSDVSVAVAAGEDIVGVAGEVTVGARMECLAPSHPRNLHNPHTTYGSEHRLVCNT